MEKVLDQSVDWLAYFTSIQKQCPWSLDAYQKGLLDIVEWNGQVISLAPMKARMYIVQDQIDVEQLAQELDHGIDTWLWSRPGYGPFATPVTVLIQQDREELARLRKKVT